jgi:hypothetical protein
MVVGLVAVLGISGGPALAAKATEAAKPAPVAPAPPEPPVPAPDPAQVSELDPLVAELRAATTAEARTAAAEKLAGLGPRAVSAIAARLWAPRASTDAERRAVLAKIKADVPNVKGTFTQPPRPDGKQPVEVDWLAELVKLDAATPGLADTIEGVALLRALAATKDDLGARVLFDFAFTPDGLIFRDECGRQVRKMAPHSFAALLRASQNKKRADGTYSRYATYQLDRLDKGRPGDALDAAATDDVEIDMLQAIRDVKHPDAVSAVLDRVDTPSHGVRKAAREAWLAYVTGPAPPPAPKAKRKLPGGKLSDKELPLWLNYRDLAETEIRVRLATLTGKEPPAKATGEEMTKELFAIYDQRRAAQWDVPMTEAAELAKAGSWAEVTKRYDAILAADPMYTRRPEMAGAYLELGRALAKEKKWDEAVVAYHKAVSLDPAGAKVKEAESELYVARAERAKATGGSGARDLAHAMEANPEGVAARDAQRRQARVRRGWMLYAGIGSGVLALLLGAVALMRRRA